MSTYTAARFGHIVVFGCRRAVSQRPHMSVGTGG